MTVPAVKVARGGDRPQLVVLTSPSRDPGCSLGQSDGPLPLSTSLPTLLPATWSRMESSSRPRRGTHRQSRSLSICLT